MSNLYLLNLEHFQIPEKYQRKQISLGETPQILNKACLINT